MSQCSGCGSVVSGSVCPVCGTRLDDAAVTPAPPKQGPTATTPALPPEFSSPQMPAGPPTYAPPVEQLSEPQSSIVSCPAGHISATGNSFCGQCGAALSTAAPTPPPPSAFGASTLPSAPAAPPSDRPARRKWPLLVLGVGVLAAFIAAGAWWTLLRPNTEDQYIEALEEAGVRSEFQTDRSAVLRAEALCEEFGATGEPKGGAAENAAVEFYCPQWLDGFQVLETATITGTFEVIDSDEYSYKSDGSYCEGEGGYGDINASTQVVVTNGEDDSLTRTELGPGVVDGLSCKYEFSFEVTEGEDMYVVAVGDRGESTYSFDELKEGLALSLG
jgi:hypothetical protein